MALKVSCFCSGKVTSEGSQRCYLAVVHLCLGTWAGEGYSARCVSRVGAEEQAAMSSFECSSSQGSQAFSAVKIRL